MRLSNELQIGKAGESVYKWWVGDDSIPGQMDLNQFLNNQVDSGGK